MTTAPRVYVASHIKRIRATRDEVRARREQLLSIIALMQPMTVRQVFYQASVHGIVDKSEAGYAKVQTDLVHMRRSGMLRYDWLADNTRWQRKPLTFGSPEQALLQTAAFYRKALWDDADCYVEVWLEKDALAGVVMPVTEAYDVPLMVARGYASLSFLHSAAEFIDSQDVPVFIYHLGDFDPSGVNAGEKIEQTLKELAPSADIHFERIVSLPSRSSAGHCRPGRPRPATPVPGDLATSRSNSTPSHPTASAPSWKRPSSGTCRKRRSGSSRSLKRMSAG